MHLLAPRPRASLLDLGGGDGSLAARICAHVPLDVTVADLADDHADTLEARGFRHVRLVEGALPFADGEFDIVLCNSVIEHVTLPKAQCRVDVQVDQATWQREARSSQHWFASEIRRVAPSYFVQTPHRHFPVEQHVHLPFVQYLSHDGLCRLVRSTDRWWVKSCQGIVDWELLAPADMRSLFPDAQLTIERFFGLPKSIIAWRRMPQAPQRVS